MANVGSRLEREIPRSVEYPLGLLLIQACLWGLVAGGGTVALALNAQGIISGHGLPPHGWGAFALDAGFLALAAGMAAVSALLLVRLHRRRAGARAWAIALECFMTCFGLGLAPWSLGGLVACGGGAVLSAAAVVCLLSRSAR